MDSLHYYSKYKQYEAVLSCIFFQTWIPADMFMEVTVNQACRPDGSYTTWSVTHAIKAKTVTMKDKISSAYNARPFHHLPVQSTVIKVTFSIC